MSTNWRELCRELINSRGADYYRTLERARKALADGPAAGDVAGPTDEELLAFQDEWFNAPRRTEIDVTEFQRATLARWGNHFPCASKMVGQPAPVFFKRRFINNPVQIAECGGPCADRGPEACDCGALWWDTPVSAPAEGEVVPVPTNADQAALMAILGEKWLSAHAPERLRHPAPVPVSERLPGPEDCDAEGRCWWFNPGEPAMSNPHIATSSWRLCRMLNGKPMGSHWLPANALPLPQGEVQP